MYIIKNAWKNIVRSKGRNVLIGIIVIVIAAAASITLAIRQSADDIVTAYREKNRIEATIGMNRNALINSLKGEKETQEDMINAFNNIKAVTIEEIENYGTSEYVDTYYYTYDLGINAENLTEATDSLVKETTETTTSTETRNFGGGKSFPGGFPDVKQRTTKSTTTKKTEKIYNEKAQNGAFTLVGYNSYESMDQFVNGEYTIIEGEVSSDFESNNVVISEELATLNNLEIGSTINLVSPETSTITFKVTVTGIYKENTENSQDMSSMFSNSANKIITNSTLIKTILSADTKLEATITPTFIIKDKESIDKFTAEVTGKGLSEYYAVTSNIDEIENATESVDNVKTFATTFLLITLIIGGVVLIVINMINIRERRYEIGVLRTIGMKKSTLSMQFIFELLVVAMISLFIGAGIGAVLSVSVSNKLLANEIENSVSKYDDIGRNFGLNNSHSTENENVETSTGVETSTEESIARKNNSFNENDFGIAQVGAVESINAVVDFMVLLELIGLGIVLTLISSLSSMVAIARFSPLTILKERS